MKVIPLCIVGFLFLILGIRDTCAREANATVTLGASISETRDSLTSSGLQEIKFNRDEVAPFGQTIACFKIDEKTYLTICYGDADRKIKSMKMLFIPDFRPSKMSDISRDITAFHVFDGGEYSARFVVEKYKATDIPATKGQ